MGKVPGACPVPVLRNIGEAAWRPLGKSILLGIIRSRRSSDSSAAKNRTLIKCLDISELHVVATCCLLFLCLEVSFMDYKWASWIIRTKYKCLSLVNRGQAPCVLHYYLFTAPSPALMRLFELTKGCEQVRAQETVFWMFWQRSQNTVDSVPLLMGQ